MAMLKKPQVIIIAGVTCSGKTALSLKIANKLNAEIVNFDSLCFYREISIGTAKPTLTERENIPHHLFDITSVASPLNAKDYQLRAEAIISKIQKPIILVGGSGFYLQALLRGMYDSQTTPPDVCKKSEQLYKQQGITPFLDFLKRHDPPSFKLLHENDHYRIRRAVEHFWANGEKISDQKQKKKLPLRNDWDYRYFFLDVEKPLHQQLIENRTKKMIESGLIDEVKSLIEQGFTGQEKPLKSIGYKESFDYLKGDLTDKELYERIVIATRQLAKAQRTWFKKEPVHIINGPNNHPQVLAEAQRFISR